MGKSFEQIGIDHSMPHIGIIMEKRDTQSYPKFDLSDGFSFAKFEFGFENQWVELMCEVEEADSLEDGENTFCEEFLMGKDTDYLNRNINNKKLIDISKYPFFEEMCRKMVFV